MLSKHQIKQIINRQRSTSIEDIRAEHVFNSKIKNVLSAFEGTQLIPFAIKDRVRKVETGEIENIGGVLSEEVTEGTLTQFAKSAKAASKEAEKIDVFCKRAKHTRLDAMKPKELKNFACLKERGQQLLGLLQDVGFDITPRPGLKTYRHTQGMDLHQFEVTKLANAVEAITPEVEQAIAKQLEAHEQGRSR